MNVKSSSATRGTAGARLEKALEELIAIDSADGQLVTAARLCRLAKVSRNSLYRYHAGVVERLQRHQQSIPRAPRTPKKLACSNTTETTALRAQVAKLVALVDHYFAAYQETQVLLQRSERQLAEARRRLVSSPRVIR